LGKDCDSGKMSKGMKERRKNKERKKDGIEWVKLAWRFRLETGGR
jgi:hypothetical protein